jgi:hypothetical protein
MSGTKKLVMKTFTILCVSLFFMAISACKKCDEIARDVPECIKNVIKEHTYESNMEIVRIQEYKYQEKIVYKLDPANYIADAPSIIVTDGCERLCYVGGFGGPQVNMCNGDNFFEKAVLVKTVWEK